jgi:hypothetical protein
MARMYLSGDSPLGHITSRADLRFVSGVVTKSGEAAGHSHGVQLPLGHDPSYMLGLAGRSR